MKEAVHEDLPNPRYVTQLEESVELSKTRINYMPIRETRETMENLISETNDLGTNLDSNSTKPQMATII